MARQSTPVLVTRPQVEGEAFAAALTARFGDRLRPVVAPLLAPRALSPDFPDGTFAAVVFTSAQAVKAASAWRDRLPALAWCVGHKTAQAATEAGFHARSADGDAESLLAALAAEPPPGAILYLRGVDTSVNILEKLEKTGIPAREIVVYVQEPQDLTPDALSILQAADPVIVPLFSPRTARLFRAALPPDTRAPLHIAAMSANVADALGDLPHAALAVAPQPDAPGMLAAVESLLVRLTPP